MKHHREEGRAALVSYQTSKTWWHYGKYYAVIYWCFGKAIPPYLPPHQTEKALTSLYTTWVCLGVHLVT